MHVCVPNFLQEDKSLIVVKDGGGIVDCRLSEKLAIQCLQSDANLYKVNVGRETQGVRKAPFVVDVLLSLGQLNSSATLWAMPIAKPIPSHWPPSLFDDALLEDRSKTWSALQVRPRAEKMVSKRLMGRSEIGYFLPYSEHDRRYQRRRVKVQELLFPGYVFAFGQSDEVRRSAYSLSGIVKHLEEPDQQTLHNSLVALKDILTAGVPVTAEERLEPGMAVEIIGGPFVGHHGRVVENKKALKFVVQLDFIQRAVSVSVDGSMVKAI